VVQLLHDRCADAARAGGPARTPSKSAPHPPVPTLTPHQQRRPGGPARPPGCGGSRTASRPATAAASRFPASARTDTSSGPVPGASSRAQRGGGQLRGGEDLVGTRCPAQVAHVIGQAQRAVVGKHPALPSPAAARTRRRFNPRTGRGAAHEISHIRAGGTAIMSLSDSIARLAQVLSSSACGPSRSPRRGQ
jgi:hypothetical protein